MAKKRKRRPEENYLDVAEDFQRHKYHPGYFTGGRIDPLIRIAQRRDGSAATARLGWVWLAVGAGLTIFGVAQLRDAPVMSILQTIMGIVLLVGGFRMIRTRRSP